MTTKKIGILTGGGDVPGLNSVIKGVVYRASELGMEVTGIRLGWQGLVNVNLGDSASRHRYVLPLNRGNTRTIDRTGGTFLHTSRTNPARIKTIPAHLEGKSFPVKEYTKKGVTDVAGDLTSQVLENLQNLGIQYLVTIGGDDTLSYSARLHHEGFPVVAIPKTMDNDVQNTEYCIGFSTAVTRAMDAIGRQRTTIGSHERIGIFRIFGRDAGFTALYTAYVTSTRCLIPEHPFNLERLIELLIKDKAGNPSNYGLVIVSEGATWEGREVKEFGDPDAFGHRKKVSVGDDLNEEIKTRTGEETVVSDLTYDLRGGEPDFVDKLVANTFGNMALDAISEGKSGLMTAIVGGRYEFAEIPDPAKGPRKVEIGTMYNPERYRPNYSEKAGLPIFLTRV